MKNNQYYQAKKKFQKTFFGEIKIALLACFFTIYKHTYLEILLVRVKKGVPPLLKATDALISKRLGFCFKKPPSPQLLPKEKELDVLKQLLALTNIIPLVSFHNP